MIYEPPSWTEFHQQTEKERENYRLYKMDNPRERNEKKKKKEKPERKTSQPHPLFQPRSVKPTAKRLPRVC